MSVSITSVSSGVTNQTANPGPSLMEAPSVQQSPTSSTIVSISAESKNDDVAKGWNNEIYVEAPGYTLQSLSSSVQSENRLAEHQTYGIEPRLAANSALRSANAELVRLQDRIETNRPSMLGKKWDFVLKDNKIEVVNDNLSSKDRQWLENTLNRNQKLVSSVQNFYGAVTKFYDHTPEHSSATGRNATGTEYAGYVMNAADQINGKIAIRDMMDKSIESFARPKNIYSGDTTKPFINSIMLAANYLKFDTEPTFHAPRYDLSDPGTAKFLKENPDFKE